MMKPTIQELHESDQYRLVESFKIDEMTQFLARELGMRSDKQQVNSTSNRRKPKSWVRFGLLMTLSLGIGWFVGTGIVKWTSASQLVNGGRQFLIGVLAFFPLITVHEFIHGIFFRQVGAPHVGYGWSWKGMMAYAYAQNYVMNLREVAYVAVMPFLFITTALLIAWLTTPQYALVWVTLLFLHTFGCLGDFVLINFWRKNQHRAMFTYDDVDNESRTYYFERVG